MKRLAVLVALSFVVVACGSTPQPTIVHVSPLISPLVSPTNHVASPLPTPTLVIALLPTVAPPIILTPTETPLPCPPFSIETKLPNPDIPENYIGLHFNHLALPKGLENFGGFLIQGSPDYALTSVQKTNGMKMYWLERLICHDATGMAYFEVRDVLSVPKLTSNQAMAQSCSVGKVEDRLILAFGKYNKNEAPVLIQDRYGWKFSVIDFAWRADTQIEKFVQVSQDNLTCVKYTDWNFVPTSTPPR